MSVPSLCRQREKDRPDRAFVTVGGRRHYLGEWGDPEIRERYLRFLAEQTATGGAVGRPATAPHNITTARVIIAYLDHLKARHHRGGKPGAEYLKARNAARPLLDLYGGTRAADLGPRALRAVRTRMLEIGCVRTERGVPVESPAPLGRAWANAQTRRLLSLLRWAASVEIIPAETYSRCATLEPLKRGDAPEPRQVRPVADEVIEATIEHCSPPVAALVRLQRLTGARAGELLPMALADIDRRDPGLWVYRPRSHKGTHRGQDRAIFLGPRCIEIIEPFAAGRPVARPLFCPREARPGGGRGGDHYTTSSYRTAIQRACRRAGVPAWHPHQIRHTVATEIRAEGGIELAGAYLGHASVNATAIYAETHLAAAGNLARVRA